MEEGETGMTTPRVIGWDRSRPIGEAWYGWLGDVDAILGWIEEENQALPPLHMKAADAGTKKLHEARLWFQEARVLLPKRELPQFQNLPPPIEERRREDEPSATWDDIGPARGGFGPVSDGIL